MVAKARTVSGYLDELERNKKDKPDQVREALDIYVALWKRAIENGVVGPSDEMDLALAKIEKGGGLYKSAGE
jgi:hypothetical protein